MAEIKVGCWVRYKRGISIQYHGKIGQVVQARIVQDGLVRVRFIGDIVSNYGCHPENLDVLSDEEGASALALHALGLNGV